MTESVHADTNEDLVVIGAGLSRTGTQSLRKALQVIYGKRCYHGYHLLSKNPEHKRLRKGFLELLHDSERGKVDADHVRGLYRGYIAAVDIPGSVVYKELMDVYPDAKVILTVRDADKWAKSFKQFILPPERDSAFNWAQTLVLSFWLGGDLRKILDIVFTRSLGSGYKFKDEKQLSEAYVQWNERVIQTIPADKLLVFYPSNGWEPLCQFLNVPIPNEPFPRANSAEDMLPVKRQIQRQIHILRWSVYCTLAVTVGIIIQYYIRHE